MLRAIETFHTDAGTVQAGDEFGDRDEIVKGRRHLFAKVKGGAAGSDDQGAGNDDQGDDKPVDLTKRKAGNDGAAV